MISRSQPPHCWAVPLLKKLLRNEQYLLTQLHCCVDFFYKHVSIFECQVWCGSMTKKLQEFIPSYSPPLPKKLQSLGSLNDKLIQAFFLSILKKTQTEKTHLFSKTQPFFPKKLPNFRRNSMYRNILLYKRMKKTQFFKKKLENFLKNSMYRNSSGSVKKPSGAQKKAWCST